MTIKVIKLPDIGEGIAEAEIVVWHVKSGDTVREDQPLVDVMTDKATVEITCPVSGVVLSTTGSAHRRCERVWLKGDELGVRFLKEGLAKHKLEWTNAAGAAARFIEPTTSD